MFDFFWKLAKDQELIRTFGDSKEFIRAASNALSGNKAYSGESLDKSIEAAYKVAGCGYENGTSWGKKVSEIFSYNEL